MGKEYLDKTGLTYFWSKLKNTFLTLADLPTASTSTLGCVKVDGSTITISNGVISSQGGSGGEPTMQTLAVTSGGTGTWYYRIWPSGWQEAWYKGSITFTNASSTAGGWNRSTQNFNLPISFADDATVLVSGAGSGRVYTNGGLKSNGTKFEAQVLGGQASSSNYTWTAWSVYVAGYGRS